MIITLIIIGWLICSILSYGMAFAFQLKEFPIYQYPNSSHRNYRIYMGMSILFSLFGPFSLLVTLGITGFGQDGLKFK